MIYLIIVIEEIRARNKEQGIRTEKLSENDLFD
jgi:hypothetical protein